MNKNKKIKKDRKKGEKLQEKLKPFLGQLLKAGKVLGYYMVISGIIIGLGFLIYNLHQFLTTSPYFALSEIELRGNPKVVTEAYLYKYVYPGENIFRIDVGKLGKKLLEDPWIEDVSIEKRLPGKLIVVIKERKPYALLMRDSSLFYVDNDGKIIKQMEEEDPVFDLPIITGVREPIELVKEAFDIIKISKLVGLDKKYGISEINYQEGRGWNLIMNKIPLEIKLGEAPFLHKLSMIDSIINGIKSNNLKVQYVYFYYDKTDRVILGVKREEGDEKKELDPYLSVKNLP